MRAADSARRTGSRSAALSLRANRPAASPLRPRAVPPVAHRVARRATDPRAPDAARRDGPCPGSHLDALRVGASRRRLQCITFALVVGVGVAGGCSNSDVTQPVSGGNPTPRARLLDTFAFNTIVDTNWVIAVGNIATYLIGHSQVQRAASPTPIRPRLVTDTITINDTVGGPPFGSDLRTPSYLTFDASGNLWMSVEGSHGDGSVVGYTRAQTSQNSMLPPSITLTGTRTPLGLRFDPKGRLWVVDSSASAVYGYTTLQLATGSDAPADTVSLTGITTDGITWAPVGLAVDAQGNLWVSAQPRNPPAGSGVPVCIVAEFTAAAVQSSGTPTPSIVVTGPHSTGAGPAMAFDSAGDLWTANLDLGTLTEFTAASLTAGSNPAPAITLTGSTFSGVGDIAIDADGILYVGGGAFGSPGPGIFAFPASALTSSGAPTPTLSYTPPTGVTHFSIR